MRRRVPWSLVWKVVVGIGVLAQIASWVETSRFLPRVPGWARVMVEAISGYLPGIAILCILGLLSMGLSRLQRLERTREQEPEVIQQNNDRAMKAQVTVTKRLDTMEKTLQRLDRSNSERHAPSVVRELEARLKALEAIRATTQPLPPQQEETQQQARRRKVLREGKDLLDRLAMDAGDTDAFTGLHEWVFRYGLYVREHKPGVDVDTGSLQERARRVINEIEKLHRADS